MYKLKKAGLLSALSFSIEVSYNTSANNQKIEAIKKAERLYKRNGLIGRYYLYNPMDEIIYTIDK